MTFREAILLISAAQGFLLSIGLLSGLFLKKWSNFFLGIITYILSIEILDAWGMTIAYHSQPDNFPYWELSSYLFFPVSLYFFAKLNTHPGFKLQNWHFSLLIPPILDILLKLYSTYANRFLGAEIRLIQIPVWYFTTQILPLLATWVVIIVWARDIYLLRKEWRLINDPKIRLHLLKISLLFIYFFILGIIWFLEAIFFLPIFSFTLFMLGLIIYGLGYISFLQPNFLQIPALLKKQRAAEESIQEMALAKEIHETFISNQIFLQPKLSLKEAAQQLNLPSRQLSEIINTYHGLDFRKYVNSLRIEEVIRKVKAGEQEQKTLLGIAMESGFNSKSAFNQAFKDLKGKSPSDYFRS